MKPARRLTPGIQTHQTKLMSVSPNRQELTGLLSILNGSGMLELNKKGRLPKLFPAYFTGDLVGQVAHTHTSGAYVGTVYFDVKDQGSRATMEIEITRKSGHPTKSNYGYLPLTDGDKNLLAGMKDDNPVSQALEFRRSHLDTSRGWVAVLSAEVNGLEEQV